MTKQFEKDVIEGLSSSPKRLPSKYFYDETGDQLFVKIMNMPEYYLTDCEMEIFRDKTNDLVTALRFNAHFDLIELGAGDGSKTIHLLEKLVNFTYKPIDISGHTLDVLRERVHSKLPELPVELYQGEYLKALDCIKQDNPRAILLLGSNIGNMQDEVALKFVFELSQRMKSGDKLLIGFDLKKSPDIILPAYNDPHGYTRAFNLNLLRRINRELDANFDLNNFEHRPEYNLQAGQALSFLTSLVNQEVHIASCNKTFHLAQGERIHTEISKKYDDECISEIVAGSGLRETNRIYDSRNYFADIIFTKS